MRKFKEFIIEKLIFISGLASMFFVILIFLFLLKEGLAVFKTVIPFNFLFGKNWYPISEPAQLGILSLILGSLLVTLGAMWGSAMMARVTVMGDILRYVLIEWLGLAY